ncbi:PEPxxWA-CTERM sorting domain-containing protein [Sphingomonas bacterium]|uniref:PEPxxWA-CTERM sorting domain-containing protein n=1 Tax=Sphingomonas bacterium TaxID=1895847 RepID=UPI0015776BD3|nr:PEPxxWA-CTERM sorting domain-containing protein [Sphingomonas bacterium]
MRNLKTVVALSVACLVGVSAADAAPLINGNFETGSLSGWTATGHVATAHIPYFGLNDPGYSSYVAIFNSGDSTPNGVLSQTVSTLAGVTYAFSFDYGVTSGGSQSIVASVIDALGQTQLASQMFSSTSTGIQLRTFNFTATSSSTTLRFADVGSNNSISQDGAIDNVALTAAAVPEPASWAMMVAGFGAVGSAMRSRRKPAARLS